MGVTKTGRSDATTRGVAVTRCRPFLTVLLALATTACGHDWSSAGDAGDTPADLPEVPPEDGTSPDEAGDATEDGTTEALDDAGAEDLPSEDAPPVECVADADCDDGNPCTEDRCDPASRTCAHEKVGDDTGCGGEGICCDGSCVSRLDVAHCGSCASACSGGPNGEPVCGPTGCGMTCAEGFGDCSASDPGCETELATNEEFCGACDRRCSEDQTCSSGDCVPSWRPTSTAGAPTARRQAAGFWTGDRLVVWGGHDGGSCFANGGRYDPVGDAWHTMAATPSRVLGCHRSAAVWTGSEMIVWSGITAVGDLTPEEGGGRYNPTTNAWSILSELGGDPSPRISPAAVWTGTGMIVWSGVEGRWGIAPSAGARYDQSTDAWVSMSNAGAPPGSWSGAVVWTGSRMIVWGGWGTGTGGALRSGGSYDPAADRWYPMSATRAPSARGDARAVWTGREMLVWGGAVDGTVGSNPSGPLGDGAAYDPATDSWRTLGATGAPTARFQNAAVWTGSRMIVWGGASGGSTPAFGDGALYDPDLDAWTPVTNDGAPSGRRAPSAVWTGERFVVWGGGSYQPTVGGTVSTNTGGRYLPR